MLSQRPQCVICGAADQSGCRYPGCTKSAFDIARQNKREEQRLDALERHIQEARDYFDRTPVRMIARRVLPCVM